MTATTTLTAPTASPAMQQAGTGRHLWRTGAAAGVAASVATFAFAGLARAIDVPLSIAGESIPLIASPS